MTGQIADKFRYQGEEYQLVGIDGSELYTAQDLDIEPKVASTACWRGHVMTYDCIDDVLVLDSMLIRTDEAPSINGVNPTEPTYVGWCGT